MDNKHQADMSAPEAYVSGVIAGVGICQEILDETVSEDDYVLNVGDFVRLRSSSPIMSVVRVQHDYRLGAKPLVHTCWFTRGLHYEASFPHEVLERA